jgi:hypothetical protein
MTTWASVGKSRYGALRGVEQFMEIRAAGQVLSLIEFIATLPGCRRMTVNEGRRSRALQKQYRVAYEQGRGPLAAVLYTSRHDEVNNGNAADLGGPNGEALNWAERVAISEWGPSFGVHFTGLGFSPPEPWHVEGDMRTPVPEWGKVTPATDAAPIPIPEPDPEDTMFIAYHTDPRGSINLTGTDGATVEVKPGQQYLWTGDKFVHIWDGDAYAAGIQKLADQGIVKTVVYGSYDGFGVIWQLLSGRSTKPGI